MDTDETEITRSVQNEWPGMDPYTKNTEFMEILRHISGCGQSIIMHVLYDFDGSIVNDDRASRSDCYYDYANLWRNRKYDESVFIHVINDAGDPPPERSSIYADELEKMCNPVTMCSMRTAAYTIRYAIDSLGLEVIYDGYSDFNLAHEYIPFKKCLILMSRKDIPYISFDARKEYGDILYSRYNEINTHLVELLPSGSKYFRTRRCYNDIIRPGMLFESLLDKNDEFGEQAFSNVVKFYFLPHIKKFNATLCDSILLDLGI
jgi:hypothetical protein